MGEYTPEKIREIERVALDKLKAVASESEFQKWRTSYLGKRSQLREILGRLGELSAAERPAIGRLANESLEKLRKALKSHVKELRRREIEEQLSQAALDVTLPGRRMRRGGLHITTQILRRISSIWAEMGFQVYRSRDVETDDYNFRLLNFPPHHPAREMQDTFATENPDVILRTHTSPGQIRVMRERYPEPIRVILPGMCYRYEQITARSEIQFNQVEGLAVGHRITMSDLKGTLTAFASRMFGEETKTRFRCSHFPFTEPSAEMDIECFLCEGKGCRLCKDSGWLEILGCGMVHPVVLENGYYDPRAYSGFAFGMGPERIAMLRYGIEDIRSFWANDLRFLQQF